MTTTDESKSTEIKGCRICQGQHLVSVLDLGNQAFTGTFPRHPDEFVHSGQLELVKCMECGLVQLKHSFDLNLLYGENYGYRSGLNQSMISHLQSIVSRITDRVSLEPGDLVVDIGSNDSTLLQAYPKNLQLVGMDPTGRKFKDYYPDYIQLIPDFFSAEGLRSVLGNKKARVITSIAMFYDLEDPTAFMRDVCDVLDDEGVWYFEQSYLLSMLQTNSYDTICHEHLEYYALKQIEWMGKRAGLRIISVEFSRANGGSFAVMMCKEKASFTENQGLVNQLLAQEEAKGLDNLQTYADFRSRVEEHREKIQSLFQEMKQDGKQVLGYGASTKGNVLLQYCNITPAQLPAIAEVNEDKFGRFTPGTHIPIISEKEARTRKPDYFFVLPWHFKESIIPREREFLKNSGRLLFPLPNIEIVI